MTKYTDWATLDSRHAEAIADQRALEEARYSLSVGALPEAAQKNAALAELLAGVPLGWNSKSYLVGDSIADDRAALNTLVNTTMQPNGGQLDIVGVPRIGSNMSIPANVLLNFRAGAYLAPDVSVTVTINATIVPTLRKIFGGAGSVTLGSNTASLVYSQWWGAVGDGVANDTPAIQSAITAVGADGGGLVSLIAPSVGYLLGSSLTIPSQNIKLIGTCGQKTRLIKGFAGTQMINLSAAYVELEELYFDGNGQTGDGIYISGGNYIKITHVETNVLGNGLLFDQDVGQVVKVMTSVLYGAINSIKINGTDTIAAQRNFTDISTAGGNIDIGGAQTTIITACQIQQLVMAATSKKLIANGNRITNGAVGPMIIQGLNHSFSGNVSASTVNMNATFSKYSADNVDAGVIYPVLAYSAAITPDATFPTQVISATNGTAFLINAPGTPLQGATIRITIRNISGGVLGVATWNAAFKLAAWTQPANGFSRTITFMYDGTNWIEVSRAAVDVPN